MTDDDRIVITELSQRTLHSIGESNRRQRQRERLYGVFCVAVVAAILTLTIVGVIRGL